MPDADDRLTIEEAIEMLEDNSGQSYVHSRDAWRILREFARHTVDEFVYDYYPYSDDLEDPDVNDAGHALSAALADIQRSSEDARGIVNTFPHEMLVTYSDVSGMLVEALGGERDETTMGGHGFTADARHDENLAKLDDLLDKPVEA